jgi:hypothetical protein
MDGLGDWMAMELGCGCAVVLACGVMLGVGLAAVALKLFGLY